MGRLVDARPADAQLQAEREQRSGATRTKEYLTRVAKYVPSEIIAAYLFLVGMVEAGYDAGSTAREVGLWAATVVGAVATPFYLNRFAEENQPKRLHLIVGTIAFIVWTYATKGVWLEVDLYEPVVAGFVLVIFSLVSGRVEPTEGTP